MDKQTYTERELAQNLELINKHPECVIEKYDAVNWTDKTYDKIFDIVDYIYEDCISGGQYGKNVFDIKNYQVLCNQLHDPIGLNVIVSLFNPILY